LLTAARRPAPQARLNRMVGQPSGFIETLPKAVRDRIEYLRTLQEKHDDLEDKYNEELRALEAKYEALYGALRATLPAHMTAPASACAPAHSQRAQTGSRHACTTAATCRHGCKSAPSRPAQSVEWHCTGRRLCRRDCHTLCGPTVAAVHLRLPCAKHAPLAYGRGRAVVCSRQALRLTWLTLRWPLGRGLLQAHGVAALLFVKAPAAA